MTHLWELGGGTFLSKLIEVPVTADNIRSAERADMCSSCTVTSCCLFHYPLASNMSVVLVLDLSKPEELWNTQETFVKQVRLTTPTSLPVHVYTQHSPGTHVYQTGFSLEIYFRMMNPLYTHQMLSGKPG